MANIEEILNLQTQLAEAQTRALGQNFEKLGQNFDQITNQLSGLASAVYTQSVTQVVPTFEGDPKKFREWIKGIEKYSKLTNLNDKDVPKIAYQACSGPVADFIRRYLQERENAREDPNWNTLKKNLNSRFAEITDSQQALAVLRKTKQKPNESVQLFAERLLNVAEDAYPQGGDRPVVEQQLINIFVDGLYYDYLKMKVLRDDPQTFDEAIQVAMKEQNIRKRFSLRQEPEFERPQMTPNFRTPAKQEEPMEVDHYRPKRCYKCKRTGHWAKECRVKTASEVHGPLRQGFGSPRKPFDRKQGMECWHCGQPGHWKKDCPNRVVSTDGKQGN